jgi:hypothetical protein
MVLIALVTTFMAEPLLARVYPLRLIREQMSESAPGCKPLADRFFGFLQPSSVRTGDYSGRIMQLGDNPFGNVSNIQLKSVMIKQGKYDY